MTANGTRRTRIIGLITALGAVGAVVLVFSGGVHTGLFGNSYGHTVTARFAAVGTLHDGDEVRLRGVKIGEVRSVDLAPDKRSTIVEMKVNDDVGPLHRDARASVRWRTVLGGAFYVGLDPGSSRAGPLGDAPIPERNTTAQVELDDVTSIVQGGAKSGLKQLPRELAAALRDPAVPAAPLDTVQQLSPEFERVGRALRGQEPDRDLRRLVAGTANTVRALGRDPGRLRGLVQAAAATLRTTADHAADIRATLKLAPGTMRSTDVTMTRLRHTLDLADPVVDGLDRVAPRVAPTLADLHPTITGADRLLRRARPLLHDLRPTVRSLAGFAQRGLPVVEALTPTLDRLADVVIPGIARKWPESGVSTTVMIGAALAGLGGIAGQKDANGHFVRFPLTAGSGTLYLPCQAFPNNPDMTPQQQIACQSLTKTIDQVLSWKPLPSTARDRKRGG